MATATSNPSLLRRAIANAVRLSLVVAIVACGLQSAMAYFDAPKPGTDETTPTDIDDLGAWTFAGEGLATSIKTVQADEVAANVIAPAGDFEFSPKAEGETRLMEFLATVSPSETTPEGRKRFRTSISGIEAFAETQHTADGDRLVVARAAFTSTGDGMTLLEIRPHATPKGNAQGASELFALDGAFEFARRVNAKGESTGVLRSTSAAVEEAANAAKRSLSAAGWSVEGLELGEAASGASLTCRRNAERMQVIVFRDGAAGDQTMVMAVKE